MLKKAISFFLLITIVAQTFSSSMLILDYYVDKQSYIKNCINKYRPWLHCNGQCQLMKKLQQKEKKEEGESNEKKSEINFSLLFYQNFTATVSYPVEITIKRKYSSYHSEHIIDRPGDIFHPPRC